jgi:HEAT repeat protein
MVRMMKRFTALLIIIFAAAAVVYAESENKAKSDKEYIADLSADKDEKAIIEAADWAGKEKKKEAIQNLVNLLGDARENVRLSAVMALGYIGDESGVDGVNNSLLNDASSEVRYAALLASFRIGSKKSIDTWKEVKEKETDPYIKDFLQKMEDKALKKINK